MSNTFSTFLENAKSILILLPRNPYFDQVAAGLALYLALKEESDVSITTPSPMTVEFNRLVGVDKVSTEGGNKNLKIRLIDYPVDAIDTVSYDGVEGAREVEFLIRPKAGHKAPKKDQVLISHTGYAADAVILVGGANENHFPALSDKSLSDAKIAHIGISDLQTDNGKTILSFARPASSASELMANMLKEADISISSDAASNLLTGMYDGSRNFSGKNVSAETFEIASDLMKAGGEVAKKEVDESSFPAGALPSRLMPRHNKTRFTGNPEEASESIPMPIPEKEQAISDPEKGKLTKPPKSWMQPKIYKSSKN